MLRKAFAMLLITGWLLPGSSWGDESVLKTSGKVLQIAKGARAAAMGEAQAGVSDDIFSIYWNPAGLSAMEGGQIAYVHNLWLGDIQDGCITYGEPNAAGGFGVGLNYVSYGEFEKIDVDAYGYPVPLGKTFVPYTMVLSGAYALNLAPTMALGMTLKLLSESVDTSSSMAIATDIGFQAELIKGLKLGLVINNLGTAIEGFSLPLNFRAGVGYRLPELFDAHDRWLLAVDASLPLPFDQPKYYNVGTEYWFLNTVALRAGYKVSEIDSLGGLAGLTAGMGIHYGLFTLDYAYAPFGDLGTSHRIGLTIGLGAKEPEKANTRRTFQTRRTTTASQKGDGADELLTPSLGGLEMRKPFKARVESRLKPGRRAEVDKAVFDLVVSEDKRVERWGLAIFDSKGQQVKYYRGEGNPPRIEWNGRNKNDEPVPESVFATYAYEVITDDGQNERLSGRVVEDSQLRAQETTGEESGQEKFTPLRFEEGVADLNAEHVRILRQVAEAVQRRPYIKVVVDGFADGGGERGQAFLLSQKRADGVARYLTATFKIPLKTISAHARGNRSPLASNESESGRAKNRRVEITIIYQR